MRKLIKSEILGVCLVESFQKQGATKVSRCQSIQLASKFATMQFHLRWIKLSFQRGAWDRDDMVSVGIIMDWRLSLCS
jgi:hypothetical protein